METDFLVKDSGRREEFTGGAVRDVREGKGRYDLISPIAMRRLALVYEKGANKYCRDITVSPENALQRIKQEVSQCKDVVNVETSFIQKDCAIDIITGICGSQTHSSLSGKEKTDESGGNATKKECSKPPFLGALTLTVVREISAHSISIPSVCGDLPKTPVICYLNDKRIDVQYVKDVFEMSELLILTMTITRVSREDTFVVAATTALECLQSLLSCCKRQLAIWRILQLKTSPLSLDPKSIEICLSGDRNWEQGMPHTRYYDSAVRHLGQWLEGDTDEDHLGHAMWNVAAIMHMQKTHPELDDRPCL